MYTFELNNERRDANFVSGKVNGKSAVVDIFSEMFTEKLTIEEDINIF